MRLPPDLELPPNYPVITVTRRYTQAIRRAFIKARTIFRPVLRATQLAEYAAACEADNLDDLAGRLAAHELCKLHDDWSEVGIAITLDHIPRDLESRARIYQLHAEFLRLEAEYLRRFGRPPPSCKVYIDPKSGLPLV